MRLFCSLLLALQAATNPPDTAHIVIVATTDVHGRVLGWDYVRDAATPGGLSRAATALETLRARYPANLVLVDWMSGGRSARGEKWCFNRYLTRNEVYRNGELVLLDPLLLDAEDADRHEHELAAVEILDDAIASVV